MSKGGGKDEITFMSTSFMLFLHIRDRLHSHICSWKAKVSAIMQ